MIDARLETGNNGGIEQALIGLSAAYENTDYKDFEYGWLVSSANSDYLKRNFSSKMEIIEVPDPQSQRDQLRPYIDRIRSFQLGDMALSVARKHGPLKYDLPSCPDEVLNWKPDLIHFPTQYGFTTDRPNIYQPHDLQHLHFPQNFSRENLVIRNRGYAGMISQASKVVVGNEWTVKDVIRYFPGKEKNVLNVPVFPQPLNISPNEGLKQSEKYGRYFFYPAGDWVHKNHERLLQALRIVVDSDSEINLVLTGVGIARSTRIPAIIKDLGLEDNVFILGYVSEYELAQIYVQAECIVMPSLFESESLPIWEAFAFRVPVISSRATAIPNQVGEAAILFDPESVSEISSAMQMIIQDSKLKNALVAEGTKRLSNLTPLNTTRGYRFAYRQALGFPIDEIDNEWVLNGFRF